MKKTSKTEKWKIRNRKKTLKFTFFVKNLKKTFLKKNYCRKTTFFNKKTFKLKILHKKLQKLKIVKIEKKQQNLHFVAKKLM